MTPCNKTLQLHSQMLYIMLSLPSVCTNHLTVTPLHIIYVPTDLFLLTCYANDLCFEKNNAVFPQITKIRKEIFRNNKYFFLTFTFTKYSSHNLINCNCSGELDTVS